MFRHACARVRLKWRLAHGSTGKGTWAGTHMTRSHARLDFMSSLPGSCGNRLAKCILEFWYFPRSEAWPSAVSQHESAPQNDYANSGSTMQHLEKASCMHGPVHMTINTYPSDKPLQSTSGLRTRNFNESVLKYTMRPALVCLRSCDPATSKLRYEDTMEHGCVQQSGRVYKNRLA